jgi:hypothetical protein
MKEHKHIWIKKSRGIGLSTFMLYVIAYKCITEWTAGDRVVIITGIRIETAADLIRRLKLLFKKNFPELYIQLTKQKDTQCIINGVIIEAYPAGHTDSIRGIDRCKFILIDEGDYFSNSESKEVRSVVEGFIGKPNSDPTIVFVSTPNRPLGLFQQIEQEQNSIYYKMFLPYQYGLEGETPIYDIETIEEAKKSPDFAKEYEGAYIGTVGNVVSEAAIQNCQRFADEIDIDRRPIDKLSVKAMGIDSAFGGGSNFSVTVIEYLSDIQKFRIIHSEEYHRPELQSMLDLIWDLRKQYGNIANIYVDGSAPVVWQSLKQMLGELWNESYMKTVIDSCKQFHTPLEKRMVVVPVNFSTEHRKLLQGMKWAVEYTDNEGKPLIGIHPRYEKLITSLRTAVTTTDPYTLNKVETSFSDSLDSFRLSTSFIKRKEK